MMYWNEGGQRADNITKSWTKTYDVLKLNEIIFWDLLESLEPKHMMYWNDLKEVEVSFGIFSWTKTYDVLKWSIKDLEDDLTDLNQNIWCIEILLYDHSKLSYQLEPKHMMYWNQKVVTLSTKVYLAWTKTYDVLKYDGARGALDYIDLNQNIWCIEIF